MLWDDEDEGDIVSRDIDGGGKRTRGGRRSGQRNNGIQRVGVTKSVTKSQGQPYPESPQTPINKAVAPKKEF